LITPSARKPLLVATVQHTGTFFALGQIKRDYLKDIDNWKRGDPVAFTHLDDHWMDHIRAWEGDILTTYRDVLETKASWISRGRDDLDLFYAQWKNWFEILMRDPLIIDVTNRRAPWRIDNWEEKVNSQWHR
jgi:hypothetical protein